MNSKYAQLYSRTGIVRECNRGQNTEYKNIGNYAHDMI